MSGALVTIIIPVFNVEKYLERCLESVINQTYRNLEIILVDDGSTDNTRAICEKYAKKDSRILVMHSLNKGPGGARNVGLEAAKGKYINFVDGDDYVTIDYIEYLYKILKLKDADISMCSLKKVYSDDECLDKVKEKIITMNSMEAISSLLCQKKVHPAVHCKLYKKEIFENSRFPEKQFFEDLAIIYKLLDSCDKIVIGEQQKYFYFQHKESIMNQQFNKKKMHRIQAANDLKQYVDTVYPELQKTSSVRCFVAGIQVFREVPKNKQNQRYLDVAWEQIIKHRRETFHCREAKISTRIMSCSTFLGKGMLSVFGKAYTFFFRK